MRIESTLACLFAISQAVSLLPGADTNVMAQVKTEGANPYPPSGSCDCDCPVEDCTGITQLPGPCGCIIDHLPIDYSNHGWMHTDWDHHITASKAADYGKGGYSSGGYTEPAPHYDDGYGKTGGYQGNNYDAYRKPTMGGYGGSYLGSANPMSEEETATTTQEATP